MNDLSLVPNKEPYLTSRSRGGLQSITASQGLGEVWGPLPLCLQLQGGSLGNADFQGPDPLPDQARLVRVSPAFRRSRDPSVFPPRGGEKSGAQ